MITNIDQLDLNQTYSYADYLTWKLKERVELIRGKIFKMSPAPNRAHQRVSGEIFFFLKRYLLQNPCELYSAPFDVLLQKDGRDTVIQPDISVICDLSKLTKQGCTGAPEIVIEILSPGNTNREMKEKFELYEENNVLEYWIVDPVRETILLYHKGDAGKYVGTKPFIVGEKVHSKVLEGFVLNVQDVFINNPAQ